MIRKLVILLIALAVLAPACAWAEDAAPAVADIGTVDWPLKQIRKYAEELPEGTVLAGQFTLLGQTWDIGAEEIDLDTAKGNLKREDLESLAAFMPNLKKVSLKTHTELMNNDIIPIVDAHPEITFVWTLRLRKYKIPTDVTAFSTKASDADEPYLRSSDCQLLKYVPGLRALDLGHQGSITDLSFLDYFPELRILILVDNRISDITPIGRLEHLQYLELFINPMIKDLSPLANCTELLDLNLSYTGFKSLQPLEACTKLERFWCVFTKLTKAEKEAFIQAHPNCETLFLDEGGSTHGTWRTHPRFFQYREMFDTGVWKEFE